MVYFAFGPSQSWGKGASVDEAIKAMAKIEGHKPTTFYVKSCTDDKAYIDSVDGSIWHANDTVCSIVAYKLKGKKEIRGDNLTIAKLPQQS